MGNATLWYLPEGSTTQVKVGLGRALRSRTGPNVQYSGAYAQALGGSSTTVIYAGRTSINIGLTWQRTATDGSDLSSLLRRKLYALEAHLKRGGSCTFAEDADYAWAAWTIGRPVQTRTSVRFQSPFITSTLSASATPLNREIYVSSDGDTYLTEMHRCTALSSYDLTISEQFREDYTDCRWVMVREAGTYPCMRVPESARSGNFLTHRDDRVFFLDLPLEEDTDYLETLAATGAALPDEAATAVGPTLDIPDFNGEIGKDPKKGGWPW